MYENEKVTYDLALQNSNSNSQIFLVHYQSPNLQFLTHIVLQIQMKNFSKHLD